MVNINIQIPDELHKRIKIVCAMKGVTLKDFVVDALDGDEETKVTTNPKRK